MTNRPHRRRDTKPPRYTASPVLLTLVCGELDENGKPCDNPMGYLIEEGGEHFVIPAERMGGDVPVPDEGEHVAFADPLTTGDITAALDRGDRFLRVLGQHQKRKIP